MTESSTASPREGLRGRAAQRPSTRLSMGDAREVLMRHAQHSSAFLGLHENNEAFAVPDLDGVILYRAVGRRGWVQLTGPCAAPGDRDALWRGFLQEAAVRGRRVVAVQLSREDADRAAGEGFTVNQIGCSYSIELNAFSLRGQRFVKTRNMVTRARREGVTVEELEGDSSSGAVGARLAEIDQLWLRRKGWHVRQLELLVGGRGGVLDEDRRIFLARCDGEVVGYVSYSPVFGDRPGWLYDLTRRHPDAPPGTIELLFSGAAERFRDEGAGWLHLGLTPFVGLDPAHRVPQAHHETVDRLVAWVGERAPWLYPAASQVSFKRKWRPGLVTPEYVAMPGLPRLADALCLARATNAI